MADQPPPAGTYDLCRRWRVPAHFLHSAERFEGSALLGEIPGPLGLLLWQCERDVRLWALAPQREREHLFTADAAERRRRLDLPFAGSAARPIGGALRTLADLLARPVDFDAEAVLHACHRVSHWAEEQGAAATALTFAEVAALAAPASARAAYRVGRLARRRGEFARAEGWLNRAIVLARQTRDRDTYVRSYSSIGNLNLLRGNLPAAERYHLRTVHLARRFGLPELVGDALHDLFALCINAGRPHEALGYADQALATFGPGHARRLTIVHDLAVLWIEQGAFERALPVLLDVVPRLPIHQQLLGFANVVRAAGALHEHATFETFWARAEAALQRATAPEDHPTALINLARGAASLGAWERAENAASRALALARQLHQYKGIFEAESLLAAFRGERDLPQRIVDADLRRLTRELSARLASEIAPSAA